MKFNNQKCLGVGILVWTLLLFTSNALGQQQASQGMKEELTLERREFVFGRVLLTYRINDQALQALLPKPWVVTTAPKIPGVKEFNYNIVLDERIGITDAAGKVMGGGKDYIVHFLVWAKNPKTGERAVISHRFFRANPAHVPGNWPKTTSLANITHRLELTGSGWEFDEVRHDVDVRDKAGTPLVEMHLQYQSSPTRLRSPGPTVFVRGVGDPESLTRIDRPAVVVEVVYGPEKKIDHRKSFTLRVADPELAPLFDGKEELTGIVAFPVMDHRHFRSAK